MNETAEHLPEGWIEVSLGDVVWPRKGKADPQQMPEAQFIGMEQVEAHTMRLLGTVPAGTMSSAANIFQASDVLYGRLRSYLNKVYSPDFAGLCSGEFIVFPETPAILGKFLKYRLNAGDFVRFATRINTGDRPRVDFDQIKVFRFPLPPKPEQSRIADTLDELLSDLDAGVTTMLRVQEKLKLFRASVLKAAVEGELTAEWRKRHPNVEPASELLKRILAERRHRWEEEQLRKFEEKGQAPPKNWKAKYKEPVAPDTTNLPSLPEGWCWTTLAHLVQLGRGSIKTGPFGSLLKKHEHQTSGVAVLGIENIDRMRFLHGSKIHISQAKANDLIEYDAKPGDVLISRSGTVGEVCVVPDNLGIARISTNLMRVRLNFKVMSPTFFCCLFNGSPTVLSQITSLCSGSTRDFLNNEILAALYFPLPPLYEQETIVDTVEDQLSIIEHLTTEIESGLKSAESLRQSILHHAFTGQLVPQDPTDEPASELLKCIATERERRIRDVGTAKRPTKSTKFSPAGRRGRQKKEVQG